MLRFSKDYCRHIFYPISTKLYRKPVTGETQAITLFLAICQILKVYAAPQLHQEHVSVIWEKVKQRVKAPAPLVIIVIAVVGTCLMMDIMNKNTMTIVVLSLLLLLLILLILLLA